MTRVSKGKFTGGQNHEADDVEEVVVKKSVSETEAEKRVWATVSKESGGGHKPGTGHEKHSNAANSS